MRPRQVGREAVCAAFGGQIRGGAEARGAGAGGAARLAFAGARRFGAGRTRALAETRRAEANASQSGGLI